MTPITEPIQVQSHAESGLVTADPEPISELHLPQASPSAAASNLPRLDVSLANHASNKPVSLPKADQTSAAKITKRVTLPALGTRDRGERWDADSLLSEPTALPEAHDHASAPSRETSPIELTHTENIGPSVKAPPVSSSTPGKVSLSSPVAEASPSLKPAATQTEEATPFQQQSIEQAENLGAGEMDFIFGPTQRSTKGEKLVSALLENMKESQQDSRKLGAIVLYTSLALIALVTFYIVFSLFSGKDDSELVAQDTTATATPSATKASEVTESSAPNAAAGQIDQAKPLTPDPVNRFDREARAASDRPQTLAVGPKGKDDVVESPSTAANQVTATPATSTPPPSESRPAGSEGLAQSSQTKPLDESVTSFFEKTSQEDREREASASAKPVGSPDAFSAPDSFPAPGPNDSALGKTHELLSAFLKSPEWKTRLKYSYQGDKLRPAMGKYYQSHSDAPVERFALQLFEREPSPEFGGPFWVYLVSTGDNDQGFPVIVRVEDGDLKVDWEIFVEFYDRWFANFRNDSDNQEKTFRIVAQRKSDYYGSDREAFERLEDFHVFELNPPYGSANEFEEYAFVPKDSPVGKKLDVAISLEDGAIPLMLTLERQAFPHGVKHIVIKDFAAEGWFR